MAIWSRRKKQASQIHGGIEYRQGDDMTVDQLNAIVNNSFYSIDFAEALADTPDISELDGVGVSSITLIDNVKTPASGGEPITYKKFKFSNLRGRSIEMRAAEGYIQWRVQGTSQWNNLISIAELQGPPGGTPLEFSVNDNGELVATYQDGGTQ